MNRYRLVLLIGLAGLVFLACRMPGIAQQDTQNSPIVPLTPTLLSLEPTEVTNTPVPTSDLLTDSKACLAHTWEVMDISQSVISVIPEEMSEEYNLQYVGTSGKGYYTLTQDGNVIMQADQMGLQFTAKASIFDVPVVVKVDGEARGKYSLEGNILTTYDMDTSGLNASAQALGQDIVDQSTIISAIPLINPNHNRAEYICSGDTLTLRLLSYPENVPPIVFRKEQ